jgi:trans-aconitate methyltransferase
MSRKVLVSSRVVYHKTAQIEVEVPSGIITSEIDNWLNENEHLWMDKMSEKRDWTVIVEGLGLDGKMNEAEATHEWRYDVLEGDLNDIDVEFTQVYGGHL